jgi:tetratricopeptide (TPR) repeat protein
MKQGKYKDAVVELTEAIRLDPNLALAYNARGFVYYLLHDYKQALTDLDAAIKLNPKYRNAYQNRALTRRVAGDAQGAAEDDARAKAAHP